MNYTDITGKDFKIHLWCKKFNRSCDDITPQEKKSVCHGCCSACVESEEE